VGRGGRGGRLLRIPLPFFLFDHVARRAVDLSHQPLHAARLDQRRRRLRLRIVLGGATLEADQAGDLVFLGLRLMHPRAGAGRARAQAAAIDLDGYHVRHGSHPRRQLVLALPCHLVVAVRGQFGAELGGEAADVARADRDAGQADGVGGGLVGVQAGGGVEDGRQHGRAVVMAVEAEHRAEGGKSPAGRRDSDRRARGK